MKIKVGRNDVVYVDMDGVLVQNGESKKEWEEKRLRKGFFLDKPPLALAIEAFQLLSNNCDIYILSTPVWDNIHCWSEKREWVEKYLGVQARKKLILTHNKALNKGLILIDDSYSHGADHFDGHHILFGSRDYPNWQQVIKQLDFSV